MNPPSSFSLSLSLSYLHPSDVERHHCFLAEDVKTDLRHAGHDGVEEAVRTEVGGVVGRQGDTQADGDQGEGGEGGDLEGLPRDEDGGEEEGEYRDGALGHVSQGDSGG